jgi:recombination protein RecA
MADKTLRNAEDFAKKYAKVRIDPKRKIGTLSTGSLKLDQALRGGIPKAKMTEIYGPPGGGKTTLALKIASAATRAGIAVAYYDMEKGLPLSEESFDDDGFIKEEALQATEVDTEVRTSWLRRNGIDPYDPLFHIYEPYTGEELFTMLGEGLPHFGLSIVDSVPAILASKVLAGEPGEASFGARAKLLAEELPRLLRKWGSLDSAIIFINQVRENIGAQVKSQKSSGGFALEHYVRCKIKTQRIGRKEQGKDVITENRIRVEKNLNGPYAEAMIRISALRGIDALHELLEFGVDFGYIHLSGSWHYFFDTPVDAATFKDASSKKKLSEVPGYLTGQNGEAAALDWMGKNNWEDKLLPLARKTFGA